MDILKWFTKDKKEALDRGVEKTKRNVFEKIAHAVAGKSKVDDEVLDQLELSGLKHALHATNT